MRWSQLEVENIIELIKCGKSYKEISSIVNRTESSIRNKANEIQIITSQYYQVKIVNKSCLECSSTFDSLEYENRKFCSKSCSIKHNNRLRKKSKFCYNCKNILSIRQKKFCCRECNNSYNKNKIFERISNGDTSIYFQQYKKYLIEKYGEKCMKCGWSERNPITKKVPIQMEHIDGNSENNSIENLELLCPNCHSLTPTFGALNKGRGRKNRKR